VAGPSEKGDNRSWWQTLPGMLTAAAGLITAITGLVVAVQQLRGNGHSSPPAQAGALTTTTTPASSPSVRSGAAAGAQVGFPAGRAVRLSGARFDVLDARATAGNPGELVLALRVRMTNQGRFPGNFFGSTFRLRVGPDASGPTNFVDDVVAAGATKTEMLDFTVPAGARRATLLVGDDPATAIALPLALGNS
jgi:hypothetical protein